MANSIARRGCRFPQSDRGMIQTVRIERQPDRLLDVHRGGRRDPHPASAEQIAQRFEAVRAGVSQPLTTDEARGIVFVDRRDGRRGCCLAPQRGSRPGARRRERRGFEPVFLWCARGGLGPQAWRSLLDEALHVGFGAWTMSRCRARNSPSWRGSLPLLHRAPGARLLRSRVIAGMTSSALAAWTTRSRTCTCSTTAVLLLPRTLSSSRRRGTACLG